MTEAELVGVNDTLGYILWACYFMEEQGYDMVPTVCVCECLWACYFMEEQGYDMVPTVLSQDNVSAILLETNGKASSTKQTTHIKVKYFYIEEKVNNGEIEIEHFPTGQM